MPGLTGEACKRLKPTGVNHGRAKKTANKYRKPEISTGHQQLTRSQGGFFIAPTLF
jgi:hypothetical protein